MEYRPLGQTDTKVSAVGLGVMTFGSQTDKNDAFRQLDMALDAGVTLFDTAENYPTPVSPQTQGRSEQILGEWIKSRGIRDKAVIATKVSGPGNAPGDMTHIRGADRCLDKRNIETAVNDSLRRLGTDMIDLYQVHWPERPITTLRRARFSHIPDNPELIPIEETLEALSAQQRAGKIRHIGVCNESPWGVMRYLTLSEQGTLPRIVSIQNSYSMLDRLYENGLAEISIREQVGLIGYSPLASGVLTGKYTEGRPLEGTRSSIYAGFETRFKPAVLEAVRQYSEIAGELGISLSSLALAFARQQPFVTSTLMAASSAQQLENNIESLEITLSRDTLKAINRIHDQHPNPA